MVNFGLKSSTNLLKSKFRTPKIAKHDIFGPFEIPNIQFTENRSGSKIMDFQQSQSLTSHFEISGA